MSSETQNRIDQLRSRISFLLGMKSASEAEKTAIEQTVTASKTWLGKQPDYLKFLQHLQSVLHQKNIGAFSELLSYFVKDVLKKDKDIVLDLYTYRDMPALKIEAMNAGHREDIFEGSGGSIANIVSTGLRLIALSRLPHRKFIILDEPDCWLKPEHVPLFAKIIGELSEQLRIQTVIVSHHDWEYFKHYGRVVRLNDDEPHLHTEIIHDTPFESDGKIDYVESIRLKRFMSHYDTELLLHPYLTCLIGNNDIGKSVFGTALKAVSYGDSSDSYIMHGESEAQVVIGISDKRQILWQRFLETNQDNPKKVKYSLYQDGVKIDEQYDSHETPDFVVKALKICITEDIDVHIGNQKQPTFLISSDVKPNQRAKILSLGKDSLLVQKMMENVKAKTRQHRQTVKDGEARYSEVVRKLSALDGIESSASDSDLLKSGYSIAEMQRDSLIELENSIAEMDFFERCAIMPHIVSKAKAPALLHLDDLDGAVSSIEAATAVAAVKTIGIPNFSIELFDDDGATEAFRDVFEAERIAAISTILKAPTAPIVKNDDEALSMSESMRALRDVASIDKQTLPQFKLSEVADHVDLDESIAAIESLQYSLVELDGKNSHLEKWKIQLAEDAAQLVKEVGATCPTCGQSITAEHVKGVHHA